MYKVIHKSKHMRDSHTPTSNFVLPPSPHITNTYNKYITKCHNLI